MNFRKLHRNKWYTFAIYPEYQIYSLKAKCMIDDLNQIYVSIKFKVPDKLTELIIDDALKTAREIFKNELNIKN